nr:hypothetical protein [Tanacetum cinerariifolium]
MHKGINAAGSILLLLSKVSAVRTISVLLVVNTPRCDEDSIELMELMVFMATASIKKVNDVVQLRALIDGKKVVVLEDVIRRDLHLDDADRVECLPNDEIFKELTRMGYEKPPPKLTFYKVFFSAQWKFLIHTLVYMVRNVDNPSKFLMYPCFLQVVMDNQVDDLTSHNTRYTSIALTQKVFANMRRVGKVPIAPAPSPPPQDPTPKPHATPPQAQHSTPHASPPQEHPTTTSESSMSLLNTLQETCATLSQKVAKLEQDEHSQALEILQLKKRVKRTYWKIIKVSGIIEAYQSFEDTLKGFDREDLIALWNSVKEKFSSEVPREDNEKSLWVELKRLFELDADDVLLKL